jgi:2-dehydro-3-deoxyphosphogluconate aldolase/(4S)-4-hydroxy-2-oxoglutarate aldolase
MNTHLTMGEVFNNHRIIPVVVLNDPAIALKIGEALINGGISVIEVTLRTPNALNVIEHLRNNLPQLIVGAGTILNDDQYHLAVKHKAQFIVSPCLSNELVAVSKNYELPFLPGAVTPSEILNAYNNGFSYLKYFPAESYNGTQCLKSIASVFPQIKFCPTGGVDLLNAKNYLSLPNVAAVGCSFLVNQAAVDQGNFASITDLALQINQLAKTIKQS